jgi:predicted alpha/beta superfamily hydrolase
MVKERLHDVTRLHCESFDEVAAPRPKCRENRCAGLALLFLAVTLAATAAHGASAGPEAFPAQVSIPKTRRLEVVSKVNGHRYAISIALPFERPPPEGYGVLYVLDGDMYFASAAEAVRGPDKAPAVVVVGIGYPDDPAYVRHVLSQRGPVAALFDGLPSSRIAPYLERLYDLSLPTTEEALVAMSDLGFPKYERKNFGGLDDFLKTIETDIKPRIAALRPIDAHYQAIFGHSFGGFAVLHAMFVEPNAFRTFIIASPAIFWDQKSVLADKEKFATAINTGQAQPRVLVTVGAEESGASDLPADWRMVDNARELVTWLKTLHGKGEYAVEECIFDKATHSYSPWPALARGVSFAFPAHRPIRKVDPGPVASPEARQ